MNSFLTMMAWGGSAWLSVIAGATVAGEFELACEIFLYGGLAGWAVVMLVTPRLAQAEARLSQVPIHSAIGLSKQSNNQPSFQKAIPLVVLSAALVGSFAGMLIAGNIIAASLILLSALAGGAIVYLGAKPR